VSIGGAVFALIAAVLVGAPARASSRAACSQRAFDQRFTGLETGVWISDAATVAGFVFFAADSARSRDRADSLLLSAFLPLASVGSYVSLAGGNGGGCVVRTDDELAKREFVVKPFENREDARMQRAGLIRMQQLILGANLVSSGLMLLFVHDCSSKIALGAATAFPAVYSLLNLRKFSLDREEDAALPPRMAVHLVPVLGDHTSRTEAGLMASWTGAF
jgi:hypothetical protein